MPLHLDHVILPAASVQAASAPFERLGLSLTPLTRHLGQGTENRALFVGGGVAEFYVELLGVHDRAQAVAAGRESVVNAVDSAPGLWRLMLATDDVAEFRGRLDAAGVPFSTRPVAREDGTAIANVIEPDTEAAGCAFAVMAYAEATAARRERHAAAGLFAHGLPLKRLDHLAAIVPDIEAATRFWTETLGLPVVAELPMGASGVIRQVRAGDAMFELIAATTDDSPLRQRPPGLISMCAFEVDDLAAAVAHLRERGFSSSDPAPGPLPATRVASIPAAELGGMTLQLLQYV